MCGRNFEYFGEDPYLAGETGKHYILGVQDEGVMATVKHFAANNQEWSRHHASSDIDERTMHEIYFPAFEMAVKEAGPSPKQVYFYADHPFVFVIGEETSGTILFEGVVMQP
jgi:beta-glucosidase